MTCDRCNHQPSRLYNLGLSHADGIEEGTHVADVEMRLCEKCKQLAVKALRDCRSVIWGTKEIAGQGAEK